MERCSPTDMRVILDLVDAMRKAGLRFVPVPVFDDAEFQKGMNETHRRVEMLVNTIEGEQGEA